MANGNSLFNALQATPTVGAPKADTRQRQIAEALIRAGSSGAPVAHPLQAVNRALQGAVGGFQLNQARQGEQQQRQAQLARQQAADDPLAGVRKNQAIAEALGIDPSTPQGKSFLSGGQFKPGDPLLDLKRQNLQSQIAERNQAQAPKFGQIGEDDFGLKQFGFIDAQNRTITPVVSDQPQQPSFGGAVAGSIEQRAPGSPRGQPIPQGADLGDGAVKSRFGFADRASAELGIPTEAGAAEAAVFKGGGMPGVGKAPPNPQLVQAVQRGEISQAALSGEDLLATLDPNVASQVRAIAEGRFKFPGARALSKPFWRRMMALAAQYEPGFDQTVFSRRNQTSKNFATGVEGRNVTALNTAIGHLKSLGEAGEALNNTRFPTLVNAPLNFLQSEGGDADLQARLKTFQGSANAVAGELAKVFKGQGAPALEEVREWKETISPNMSPTALRAVVANAIELMNSRLDALGVQYNQGMSTDILPKELLSPKSRKILEELETTAVGARERTFNPQTRKLE